MDGRCDQEPAPGMVTPGEAHPVVDSPVNARSPPGPRAAIA